MSSVISKTKNTLLKSKTTKYTKNKHTKNKHTKNKHTKNKHTNNKQKTRQRIIDKYCAIYKNDINGKPNKKLYMSCKINKYCRKYKCQDIDYKIIKEKQKKIGPNYNKIIFDKIKSSCPQKIKNTGNILEDDDQNKIMKKQKQCENKALKQIYKDNNLEEIYKKSVECDNIICAKEQKIFNINLFRQKQIKVKKSKKNKINSIDDFQNEPDLELIERGD
jgi:hypothetical protein